MHSLTARSIWRLAFLFLALVTGVCAQTPTAILALKLDQYQQTSATAGTAQSYDFVVIVGFPGTVASGTTVQVRSSAGQTVDLALQPDTTFTGTASFGTRAELEAAFPDGNYTVKVTSLAGGTTTFKMTSGPTISPVLITDFDYLQAAPSSDYTIKWEPIAGAQADDFLSVSVAGQQGTTWWETPDTFSPLSTSASPVNLPLNTPLVGELDYASVTTTKSGSTDVATGRGFSVVFPMRVAVATPTITQQPTSTAISPGGSYPISVAANSNGSSLVYQWKKDGTPVPFANDATYTINAVDDNAAGVYTVDVRNVAGVTTSDPALIAFISTPSVFAPASPQIVRLGSPVTLNVKPSGPGYTYQWKRNGVAIAGATSATFSLSSTQAADAGAYTVDVATAALKVTAGSVDVLVKASATLTPVAGILGSPGFTDGPAGTATLANVGGMAFDRAGNLYTIDSNQQTVRKIATDGSISTFAGSPGNPGLVDGVGTSARLQYLSGIAIDADDNIYVTEYFVGTIRKITPQGVVSWFTGDMAQGRVLIDGPAGVASFDWPGSISASRAGLVVLDGEVSAVRRVDWSGAASTVHGNLVGAAASFFGASSVAIDDAGAIYVLGSNGLWKVLPDNRVIVLAGKMVGSSDFADGLIGSAQSNDPTGAIATDGAGTVYFCDHLGFRRITPDGLVETLLPGKNFGAIAVDRAGNVYVADNPNGVIERVTINPGGSYTGLSFTAPPQAAVTAPGATTLLSAAGSGPGVKYQWFKNGVPLSGQTTSTLLAWNPQPNDGIQ